MLMCIYKNVSNVMVEWLIPRFVLGMTPVQISTRRQAILNGIVRGFRQYFQANAEIPNFKVLTIAFFKILSNF